MKPKTRIPIVLAAFLAGALLAGGQRVAAADCSPTPFVAAREYPAPDLFSPVATGDFNNDGVPDLVFLGIVNDTSVLIGNGDGTFQPPLISPTGMSGRLLIAGFFDGDANLDLAAGDGDRIYVAFGNGNGTFQPANLYTTGGGSASGFAAVDLDGDGALDLVETTTYNLFGIFVLINNGDGTFASAVAYPTLPSPQSVAAGNLDPDGHPDLAVTFDDGTIGIYPGVGDGTFAAPSFIGVGPGLSRVIMADLDGDGPLDLAVGRDRYVDVLHGNGDRTFLAAVEYRLAPGYPASDIRDTDLDGDGRTDLAVLQPGFGVGSRIQTLFQTPSGQFVLGGAFEAFGGFPFASADFDANGRIDFAVGDSQRDVVMVLLTQSDGRLRSAQVAWPDVGAPTSMAGGDFDGDGRDDLVTLSHFDTDTFVVLARDARGIFSASGVTVTDERIASDSMVARDFDRDGATDLAVWTAAGVWVLIANGDGTFQPPVTYPVAAGAAHVAAGDFDGDGLVDLAYGSGVNPPGGVSILFGNGDGTFQPALPETPLPKPIRGLAAADLNGDGKGDLIALPFVCCADDPQTVYVLLGNGDGTFQGEIEYFAGQEPSSIATGDFDGDSDVDVLVADRGASTVALLPGDGSGRLADPVLFDVGAVPVQVIAADFDGDGHLDAATSNGGSGNGNSNTLSVLIGTGHGGFQAPVLYPTESTPAFPVAGRWSAGRALGLAALNIYDYTVTIYSPARLSISPLANVSVIVGSSAVLQASASGFGPLTYQWRKDGVPLSDGGPISGSTTATLTVDPVAFTDAGSYDVVVTDSCTTATSNAVTLSVEFDDVPLSNPFHDDIITIATAGITTGCTATSYCPSADVSRAEMAVLLLKSKFGSDHVPPPPGGQIFNDVPPGSFAEEWIAELAGLGITAGCGNGNYCPDAPVTRAEMAVFLLKTLLGSGYVPQPATGIFADVPSDYFAIDWIEDLYLRGITAGCATGPLRYCPDQAVPREQMATFLVRTFLGP